MRFRSTMWLLFCLTFYVCLTTLAAEGPHGDKPLVASKYGLLQGRQFSVKGTSRDVDVYLGVPFAKPPVGPLRFSPPQPPESWNGIRDAVSYPPMCLQTLLSNELLKEILRVDSLNFSNSEDCLYLNVYTPADRKEQDKLPVMVWIHGGGLVQGAASLYDGSALSVYENVVIVSIQYRLGLLGFFSSGDELAPGNWGFLDQVAALQWVQENIASFGGDPDSVTIFGESAGGVSVSALILSPLSKGLFHKAISQSGSILFPGLFCSDHEVVLHIRDMMANITGCEPTNSAAIVNCLKKKTEEEILEPVKKMPSLDGVHLCLVNHAQRSKDGSRHIAFHEKKGQQLALVPANVDGVFITKAPEELMSEKEINPVPYLMGVNNDECGWIFPTIMNISNFEDGITRERITSAMPIFRQLLGSVFEFIDVIVDEYLGDTDDPIKLRDLFLDMLSDIMFIIPAVRTARFHRDSGLPIYFYEYQHRPSMFQNLKPAHVKADHGDEIGFVFGVPFLDGDITIAANFTDEEKTLSRRMMNYWANFARNGNPNGDGLMEWPAYGLSEQYLQIDIQQKLGKQLKDHRMAFWNKALPEKISAINAQKKQHIEL